ncbi:copper resistance protein CopC [Acinetobacter sp.]|jgi:methionine-rich copper-binding protein CopC|uniref:Copper resistance protein C n=1 Tax=Acinetobacter bereziniae TaxID=106648 RepID=A0A833PJP4_ACIBZ|nr:copper resistance protein CopC [Acinetobacter sp.]KAF1028446.1 MAG: Protein YobA [Acinetobacter bereziniae]MDR0235125.1 copper resistance protein CopC [Acinetobacter sp.]
MSFFRNKITTFQSIFLATALLISSSNALAHVKLLSAIPAINATVTAQPKNLILNFGEDVMLMNIKLSDAQQNNISLNYKVSHDLKKSFNIATPNLNKGKYTVSWSTMGKDGHNMNGEYSFIYK